MKAIEQQPDVAARYWNAALALDQAGQYERSMLYARKYADMEQNNDARQRAIAFMEQLNGKMAGRK
jgi:hypothetical protein